MSIHDKHIVMQDICSVLKVYPKFIRLLIFSEPFNIRRFDMEEKFQYGSEKKKTREFDNEDYENQSIWRARVQLIDLCLSNDFNFFITITFKKDRYDVDAKKKQIQIWLNNQRNQYGPFGYVLVPEFHKDGAVHFHGLFKGYGGVLVDSGKKTDRKQTIYNIASFHGGFTTAVEIDDISKVAGYISKYITKDMLRFKNRQRYFRSNRLLMPFKYSNPLLTEDDIAKFTSLHKGNKTEVLELMGQLPDSDLARITDFGRKRYDDLFVTE